MDSRILQEDIDWASGRSCVRLDSAKCDGCEIEILSGNIGRDHIHIFIS